MDIALRIIDITFPIFSIVALGLFCGHKFSPDMRVANRLNMDVFIPALVFSVIIGQSVDVRDYLPLILASLAVVLGSGVLIWPIAHLFKIELKTLAPPMMFNNAGNMGLPLMILTFGEQALPIAMILFLVENTTHFTLGMAWLNNAGKGYLRSMISPLTVASFIAIVLGMTDIKIHPTLMLPIDMIGQIVIPLMLFSLGVRLSTSSLKTLQIGLIGGIACPLSGLIMVVLVLPFFDLNPMQTGGFSKDYAKTKQMMYNQPELFQRLLDKLVASITGYLNAQIEAGAQAIQIFDSWGGALSHDAYHQYSLKPMEQIIQGLIKEREGRKIPVILFTKGGGQWLESMAKVGADCLGLDWTTNMTQARERVGAQVALQGNMDPAILYTSPKRIRQEVASILKAYGSGSGHIFNLGHGVTPHATPENVGAFFEAVAELSSV